MRLRRSRREPVTQLAVADPSWAAAWEGLPTVMAARVVIRAAQAADLAGHGEAAQVA